MMGKVMSGLGGCSVYINDIIVFSQDWVNCLSTLWSLFKRLSAVNLTFNFTYLGHEVGSGLVKPTSAKVESILNLPVPSSKELIHSLGMVSYFRKFCKNFSVAPLTDRQALSVKFDWTVACQFFLTW